MGNLELFAEQDSAHDGVTVAGVKVRQDANGRFCLNDLHKAAGSENRYRPNYWQELQQTQDLTTEIEKAGIPAIESKPGVGTFVAKELVYAYAMWVSASFHLQVIRAYDAMAQKKRTDQSAQFTQAIASTPLTNDIAALDMLARVLNVAESGKLGMMRVAINHHAPHLLPALPGYAVDAPKQGAIVAGSSEPTFSATHLLKEHGMKITAARLNVMLCDDGIIERKIRTSSGSNKSFWCITDKGLAYGKNVTSDSNPRETQPHWYASKFGELLSSVSLFLV